MDLYAILGLAPGASVSEVKRAYRRLSRRYHPGINPGDRAAEAMFRRITEAYETLVDAERRQRYEGAASQGPQAAEPALEFAGFDFTVAARGADAATFSELFAEALHPRPRHERGHPEPGADLHTTVVLGFDEAMRGALREVTATRQVACRPCHATGVVRIAEAMCGACEGSGKVRWARGHMVFTRACGTCGGSGQERQRRCPVCAGHGRIVRGERVAVRLPAGVVDGARLRLPGQGHAGTRGAKPGDLYVDVSVRAHPVLRREGDDLHLVLPVAVHEAVLGTRIEVPSFDGPVRVRIPPGTQAGQRFRISGRGAVTMTGGRGDLVVEARLTLPGVLDARSKALMQEFGRLNNEDVRRGLFEQFDQEARVGSPSQSVSG